MHRISRTDYERRFWVMNTPLAMDYRRSRQSLLAYVATNRDQIDQVIDDAVSAYVEVM